MKTESQIQIEMLKTALVLLMRQHESMNADLLKIGKGRGVGHGTPYDAARIAVQNHQSAEALASADSYVYAVARRFKNI